MNWLVALCIAAIILLGPVIDDGQTQPATPLTAEEVINAAP
jgi:hypothetical protein